MRLSPQLLPCGSAWDAVRVPSLLARTVLGAPGGGISGPIICDPAGQAHFFLVPPGTSDTWALDGTSCLGYPSFLFTPGAEAVAPPGLHWAQTAAPGSLVDPEALRDALMAADAEVTV